MLHQAAPPKAVFDPELDAVVAAWPTLPADVRKMIAGVVNAIK